MRGTWFDKLWTSTFGLLDLAVELARQAALSGSPAECPLDAIDYHARDRMLERIVGETDEALRDRVVDAWGFWSAVTTTSGLQDILRAHTGCDEVYVYDEANDGWVSNGVGAGYDDTNTDLASRHAVVIGQTHPWAIPTVGPGPIVGPGLLVGIDMTLTELSMVRRIYRRHRPANMIGSDIFVLFDATTPADVLVTREASASYVRIPLHVAMVGYPNHGMTVGDHLTVGRVFT